MVIEGREINDELHTTNEMMLFKRWTSISTYFRNASVKNKKDTGVRFFYLNLMNTNIWILKDFNYIEKTICTFSWIFLLVEGVDFIVKFVATKVIHQHMFFFTLFYSFDNNLWNEIKI